MQWNNPFKIANMFQKSEFAKNSLTLTSGIAVAQILPILFYPILGRIFTPEEFGLQASLMVITTILTTLASGKYESSIILSETKEEAAHITILCLIISLITLTILYIVLQFAISPVLSETLNEPRLNNIIFICPLSALAITIFTIYNEWCIRNKYFKKLSTNKIVNSGAIVTSETAMGFLKISSFGLIIGDTIGRWISAIGCIVRCLMNDKDSFKNIRMKEIKRLARKNIDFPKFTLPGDLLNTLGQRFPVLILAIFFCQQEVGYFSMAMVIIALPITIIGSALRDVFKQKATEEIKENGNCISIFKKIFAFTSVVAIVGFCAVIYFLPDLFSLVIGESWTTAGKYSQILGATIVFSFVSIPLSGVFIVTEKLRAYLIWQIYYVIVSLGSITIGALISKNITQTLILFAIFRSSAYILSIALTYYYAKGNKIINKTNNAN